MMLMQPNIMIVNIDGLAFGVVTVVHSPCLPMRPYLRPEMTLAGAWGKYQFICLSKQTSSPVACCVLTNTAYLNKIDNARSISSNTTRRPEL